MPKRKCATKQRKISYKNRKSNKRTRGDYEPLNDYYTGRPTPRDPLGWQNAPDIPNQRNDDKPVDNSPPIISIESGNLEDCSPKERKEEEENRALFMKIKGHIDNDPRLANLDEPTIKIAYNGIPINVPISMMPEDETFLSKYGDKIKHALIAAGAMGTLAFGGKKVWSIAGPVIVVPLKLLYKGGSKIKGGYNWTKDFTRNLLGSIGKLFNGL